MATTHDATLKVSLYSSLANDADPSNTAASVIAKAFTKHFTTGTGADQSNQVYAVSGECANSTDSIDVTGALTNKYGETVSLTKVKGIFLVAGSANTVAIEVTMPVDGVAFCKTAADAILLRPGGCVLLCAPDATGYAAVGGATDQIDLTAAAGTATYDLIIWGV